MRVGLKLNGKYLGIEPGTEAVYADRNTLSEWEQAELTRHGSSALWDLRFVAANRTLTITPDGKLESRAGGAFGAWEQLQVMVEVDGTKVLYRPGTPVPTLTIEGFVDVPSLSKLHVDGLDLKEEGGRRHLIKGSTELLLGWRYDLEGGDAIREVLDQRKFLGFNNLRVLWQKDINNTGHSPWLMPLDKLRPFLELAASYGFYIQGTILADCQVVNPSTIHQGQRVQDVRHATEGVTSLIEQLGNEYDKNGFEPNSFIRPTDRLAANASSIEGGKDAPYWDFFCFSGQRSPVNHAIREYGPIEFMLSEDGNWGGVPALCDECFKPGKESSNPRDWERAGAQARSGIGGRFHTVSGTSGNSSLFNDLERDCAAAFTQGIGV